MWGNLLQNLFLLREISTPDTLMKGNSSENLIPAEGESHLETFRSRAFPSWNVLPRRQYLYFLLYAEEVLRDDSFTLGQLLL